MIFSINRALIIEEIISKVLGDSLAVTKSLEVIKPGFLISVFSP